MDKKENCLKLCLAVRLLLVLLLMGSVEFRVLSGVVLALPCIRSPEDYLGSAGSTQFLQGNF